jgi:hypothetical protein
MRLYKLLLVFLIFVFTSLAVSAQSKDLPTTNFGRLIQEWLKVIESGTEAEIKTFVENNFSTAALRSQSLTETVFIMRKLQKQSGGHAAGRRISDDNDCQEQTRRSLRANHNR